MCSVRTTYSDVQDGGVLLPSTGGARITSLLQPYMNPRYSTHLQGAPGGMCSSTWNTNTWTSGASEANSCDGQSSSTIVSMLGQV
jgi:hypothetical protein